MRLPALRNVDKYIPPQLVLRSLGLSFPPHSVSWICPARACFGVSVSQLMFFV